MAGVTTAGVRIVGRRITESQDLPDTFQLGLAQLDLTPIEMSIVDRDNAQIQLATLDVIGIEMSVISNDLVDMSLAALDLTGIEFSIVESEAFRADTLAYQTRVETDGGEVVDMDYVNNWFQTIEDQGLGAATGFIGGPNMGVKKAGGIVEKLYNLIDVSNDASQNGSSGRPADTTDLNAGARVLLGDGVNDVFGLDTQITVNAGSGTFLWWQVVNPDEDGYWCGTTSSSQNGIRCLNTTIQMRAGGTFSSFSIPSGGQIKESVMRSICIIRDNTDNDRAWLQGVQIGGTVVNANNFSCPDLLDGVNVFHSAPLGTMCILQTGISDVQRQALEAIGNTKHLLPNSFKQTDEFLIAIVPDIQNDIAAGGTRSQSQANWINTNRLTEDIQAVIYLGDQANDGSLIAEHNLAKTIIDTNLATIPHLWVYGNHDADDNAIGGSARDSDNFNSVFPTTELTTQSWWNGGFESTFSSAAFFLFSHSGTDYILVTLPFGPTQDEIDWINTLLGTTYPTRTAILFTHSYLDEKGDMSGPSDNDADIYGLGADVHVGTEIRSDVSDIRSNLRMIFNGHHVGGDGTSWDQQDVSGETQTAVYCNYQDQANNGDGFMGLLYINPVTATARFLAYSPHTDEFKPDSEWAHKFAMNI